MELKSESSARARGRLIGILLCLALIVFVIVMTAVASAENRKTIPVVRLKQNIGANAMINADMVEKYDMYYKEFEQYGVVDFADGTRKQAVVLWDDRDLIINQRYAAYYLRQKTVLFWDSTIREQSRRNSYLYNMDGELLNIQLDTSDFGDMVVPGDTLNIRVSYADVLYDLPTEEQYQMSSSAGRNAGGTEITQSEMLFHEVSVLDMLNADGRSVFDIYYDFISQSKSVQASLLEDDDFLRSVEPTSILLEVTAEEADRFMEIKSKSPTYLITLLPRTSSNAILDSLSDIEKVLAGNKEG